MTFYQTYGSIFLTRKLWGNFWWHLFIFIEFLQSILKIILGNGPKEHYEASDWIAMPLGFCLGMVIIGAALAFVWTICILINNFIQSRKNQHDHSQNDA